MRMILLLFANSLLITAACHLKPEIKDNPVASNNSLEAKLDTAIASNNKLIEALETSVDITGNSVSVNGEVLEKLEKVAENIKVQLLEIKTEITGDGNKVNDPYIAWILALCQPVMFLIYLLMHRSRGFRKVKDAIRGKSNSSDRAASPSGSNGFLFPQD